MALQATAPFRFLDLPVEIRLMVYEFLPIGIKHRDVHTNNHTSPGNSDESSTTLPTMTLVIHTTPAAILATCRLINLEATSIITRKLETILPAKRVKIIVDSRHLSNLANSGGLLHQIVRTYYGAIGDGSNYSQYLARESPPKLWSPSGCCESPITEFVHKSIASWIKRDRHIECIEIRLRAHPHDGNDEITKAVHGFCSKAAEILGDWRCNYRGGGQLLFLLGSVDSRGDTRVALGNGIRMARNAPGNENLRGGVKLGRRMVKEDWQSEWAEQEWL